MPSARNRSKCAGCFDSRNHRVPRGQSRGFMASQKERHGFIPYRLVIELTSAFFIPSQQEHGKQDLHCPPGPIFARV